MTERMAALLTEQKLRAQEKALNWERTYFETNCGHVGLEVPEEHLLGNVGREFGEKLLWGH